jgi:hypothetical protein
MMVFADDIRLVNGTMCKERKVTLPVEDNSVAGQRKKLNKSITDEEKRLKEESRDKTSVEIDMKFQVKHLKESGTESDYYDYRPLENIDNPKPAVQYQNQPSPTNKVSKKKKKKVASSLAVAADREVVKIPGYVGKLKGQRDILKERGKFVDGMQGPQSEDTKRSKREKGLPTLPLHLCTTYVLSQEPDFLGEISALEEVILKYGYRMVKSPKCHPEVAGTGIEYIWGFSKSRFRNKTNDGVPKNLEKNILKSLSIIGTDNLCHERVMRYARKSRDYIMAYKAIYMKTKLILV